jgi:hypothetical protein
LQQARRRRRYKASFFSETLKNKPDLHDEEKQKSESLLSHPLKWIKVIDSLF